MSEMKVRRSLQKHDNFKVTQLKMQQEGQRDSKEEAGDGRDERFPLCAAKSRTT